MIESTPEIVPGSGNLTSVEYDAIRRDLKTLREHVLEARDERRISDEKFFAALGEIRQDLAIRDHKIAETTLRLHQDSSQKHETIKLALETLNEKMEAQHREDMEWKERFKRRVLDLQDRVADEPDVLAIPGVHASWEWWRKAIAVGLLVLAGSVVSSGLTACAARGGLLDTTQDAEVHR